MWEERGRGQQQCGQGMVGGVRKAEKAKEREEVWQEGAAGALVKIPQPQLSLEAFILQDSESHHLTSGPTSCAHILLIAQQLSKCKSWWFLRTAYLSPPGGTSSIRNYTLPTLMLGESVLSITKWRWPKTFSMTILQPFLARIVPKHFPTLVNKIRSLRLFFLKCHILEFFH